MHFCFTVTLTLLATAVVFSESHVRAASPLSADEDPLVPEIYYSLIHFHRNATNPEFHILDIPLPGVTCHPAPSKDNEDRYACTQHSSTMPTPLQMKRILFWINRKFSYRHGQNGRIRTPADAKALVTLNTATCSGNRKHNYKKDVWVNVYELKPQQESMVKKWLLTTGLGCVTGGQWERCIDWEISS